MDLPSCWVNIFKHHHFFPDKGIRNLTGLVSLVPLWRVLDSHTELKVTNLHMEYGLLLGTLTD